MKRFILVWMFVLVGLCGSAQAEDNMRLGFDAFASMNYIPGVIVEYRLGDSLAIGYEYDFYTMNDSFWNPTDFTFSLPFARYYFSGLEDSLYVGAGILQMTAVSSGFPGTSVGNGFTSEFGYQWRWDTLDMDFGYELWNIPSFTLPSGSTFNLGSFGGLVWNMGIHF